MGKKLFSILSMVVVISMLIGAASFTPAAATRSVSDMSVLRGTKFDAHYRVPNEAAINTMLEEEQVLLPGASGEAKAAGMAEFLRQFHMKNPDTPTPYKLKELLDFEGMKAAMQPVETDRSIKSLVTLVEFPDTPYTWTAHVDPDGNCVDNEVTFQGPLHGQIAPPGPRDNNTLWYDDPNPELYEEIFFGEGPNAGVVVNHPNLGKLDFRGRTMVNYYLEQSGGKFAPSGMVFPEWLMAQYPEAYYGEDGCSGSHNVRAQDLVAEVLATLETKGIQWQDFDGNEDGIVDNFTVIHAGDGQESGGGVQGNFSIWSHASLVGWPDGVQVCAKGDAACPDRDIFVREYSMDPEMIDLGVISEEFGHAAFGLPDIYTTDAQGSPSNWAIMESGSWNGELGGMYPAPFPLWFRYIIGWAKPKEISYDAKPTATVIGQHSQTPKGLWQGLKINLPDKEVTVPNPLDSGQAAWSNVGDVLNNTLTHQFDLTGTTAPIFSFNSYWSIEVDWDYGYVEVSTDNGATWTLLPDMDGIFVTTNENGNNAGIGLTGEGSGVLRFDLSAYAGQTVLLRTRYSTDMAAQWDGWWMDDVQLTDGATVLFSEDFEEGLGDWTSEGWVLTPYTQIYPRYYLAEWRNYSGFDKGLKYPYATVYNDVDEWEVDRGPYTAPGMLLWFRDTSYAFDYTLRDALQEGPSWGAKHALLVVDSHYWPYEWDRWTYASTGAKVRLNARLQPGNATFTLQETVPFSVRLGADPNVGVYLDEPIDEQTFGPQPAVSQFHDSLGYTPGLWLKPPSSLVWWDRDASMVIPAKGDYTTKITWDDKTPATDLYGIDMGSTILGSGNPGDDGVQYGLHIAVTAKAKDGKWGLIQTWNAKDLTQASIKVNKTEAKPGAMLIYSIKVKNTSPVMQKVSVASPIPAGTTYVFGYGYKKDVKEVQWSGMLPPMGVRVLTYAVRVDKAVTAGTVLTGAVTVVDDALGAAADVMTTVK